MPVPLLAGAAIASSVAGGGWLGKQLSKNRPWGVTEADWKKFQQAQQGGFAKGYNEWVRKGKPSRGATPYTKSLMATPEYAEAEATRRAGGKTGLQLREEKEAKPPVGEEDAFEKAEREKQEREDARWEREFAEKQRQFNETQKMRQSESGVKMYTKYGINPYDNPQTPEEEGQFNPYTGQWESPQGWMNPYQQGQLSLQEKQMEQEQLQQESLMGWYREQAQMQQQEQERQYRSQLMANPMSWLQYSSYTGQAPVIQEWMKPLMSGQYQTGQQIPGWTGGGGEGQAMGSLPELRTPSAQLWSRMGPTAQSQYMGYGQARTGIRPEETAFRQWATAPPSGNFGGLRRMR